MKRFVLKVAVYLSIICIITYSINHLYMQKYDWGAVAKFKDVPQNIQICNFGSSHGQDDYNYSDLEREYTCFNFALASQSLVYDSRILDYYQDHISEGAVVIITISYFSGFGMDEKDTRKFESKNSRYYTFLPKEYITGYDPYLDVMMTRLKSTCDGPIVVLKTLINKKPKRDRTVSWSETNQKANEIDLEKYVQNQAVAHIVTEKRDNDGNIIYNCENEQALREMIDICRERKAVPVLITPPFLFEYNEKVKEIDSDFYKHFYEWIARISSELSVEYIDYSHDDRFTNRKDLFINGDHLNTDGAKLYMKILYNEHIKNLIVE